MVHVDDLLCTGLEQMTMTMRHPEKSVQQSLEVWPDKHVRRGHDPAKKSRLQLMWLALLATFAPYTLLMTVCSTSNIRETSSAQDLSRSQQNCADSNRTRNVIKVQILGAGKQGLHTKVMKNCRKECLTNGSVRSKKGETRKADEKLRRFRVDEENVRMLRCEFEEGVLVGRCSTPDDRPPRSQ